MKVNMPPDSEITEKHRDESRQNQGKIKAKRGIIGTTCACGKVHKTADTYYRHRNSGKYNDKTGAADITIPATSPPLSSFQKKAEAAPVLQSVLQSNIIHEINMNKEFETMAEKFKGASVDAEKEKKYKYRCGKCNEYFNTPGHDESGNVICPLCGDMPT